MASAYYATVLIGGGAAALDFFDGAALSNDDLAFVLESGVSYEYKLNATSAAAESSPNVIMPDTNAGNKRWILQPRRSSTVTNKGIIEISTDAEAEAKAETDKALVPSNLAAIFLDEDDMASDSATKICSQQSIVAYVDTVRDVPTGEKILFYKNTVVTGYTLLDTLTDKVAFITKGSAAGGETGGAVHSSGAWTHTHTYNTVISHLHSVNPPNTTSTSDGSHSHTIRRYSAGGSAGTCVDHATNEYANVSAVVNAAGSHNHDTNISQFNSGSTGSASGTTQAQTAWRPAAYCFTMQQRV